MEAVPEVGAGSLVMDVRLPPPMADVEAVLLSAQRRGGHHAQAFP